MIQKNNFLFFSYWDLLPLELKIHIIKLAIAQFNFEKWLRKNLEKIHHELFQLNILKEMWNTPKYHGIVTYKIKRCESYYCTSRVKSKLYKKAIPAAHYNIIGFAEDEAGIKHKYILGHDYKKAKERMNHIKSFLY